MERTLLELGGRIETGVRRLSSFMADLPSADVTMFDLDRGRWLRSALTGYRTGCCVSCAGSGTDRVPSGGFRCPRVFRGPTRMPGAPGTVPGW